MFQSPEKGASNRIKRFSSTGVLQLTYGTNGGRTDGLYQNQRTSFRGGIGFASMSFMAVWCRLR